MTTDRTDEKTMADYRQALMLALRLKDVPGDRIGEILAEVESHVSDTGEDPTEAFGPPREYAAALTAGQTREPWWSILNSVVPAGIAGWLVAQGSLDLLLGETSLGQPGWLWLTLGLLIGIPVSCVSVRVVGAPWTCADSVDGGVGVSSVEANCAGGYVDVAACGIAAGC